jgi:hypothetical protein
MRMCFNPVMYKNFHEKMEKLINNFAEMSSSRNALLKELRWVDSKAAGMIEKANLLHKAKFEICTADLLFKCLRILSITQNT